MTLKEVVNIFNRSLAHIFVLKKILFFSIFLFISGSILLFSQNFITCSTAWFKLLIQYVPLYLAIGCTMIGGIFLIRIYDKELKEKDGQILKMVLKESDGVVQVLYLILNLLVIFLLFWLLIGIFLFLKAIPYLGPFFGIFLAFIPFLLNFGILLLFVVAFLSLFFLTPYLAKSEKFDRFSLQKRLKKNGFLNFLLLGIGSFPFWITWLFAKQALLMTFDLYVHGATHMTMMLQGFFILVPFTLILTPTLIFLFHFSYESYLIFIPPHESLS
ncbi:MAG: hypothetical protein R3E91_01290 [Chlamydiales bacterium]